MKFLFSALNDVGDGLVGVDSEGKDAEEDAADEALHKVGRNFGKRRDEVAREDSAAEPVTGSVDENSADEGDDVADGKDFRTLVCEREGHESLYDECYRHPGDVTARKVGETRTETRGDGGIGERQDSGGKTYGGIAEMDVACCRREFQK